jgi:hypothetical protein
MSKTTLTTLILALGAHQLGGCESRDSIGTVSAIAAVPSVTNGPPPGSPLSCVFGVGGAPGSVPPDPFCGLACTPYVVPAYPPFVDATMSTDPLPEGRGGEIVQGKYVLTQIVQHGPDSCFHIWAPANPPGNLSPPPYNHFQQVLELGPSSGSLIDNDNQFLFWPATFEYATNGNAINVRILCPPSPVPVNDPFGPFGPFETYTASAGALELFSPKCHFRTRYERSVP